MPLIVIEGLDGSGKGDKRVAAEKATDRRGKGDVKDILPRL